MIISEVAKELPCQTWDQACQIGGFWSGLTNTFVRVLYMYANPRQESLYKLLNHSTTLPSSSSSTKLQAPKQKQFLATKTVQFLGGPWPWTAPVRLIKSLTTALSSVALSIPHRLHFLTFPLNNLCFRRVSHNVPFATRCWAPGGVTALRPNQVVS